MSTAVVRKDRKRRSGRGDSNQKAVSRFAGDAYSLAARAAKGVKYLSKLINIETKYADYVTTTGITTTPFVMYVSALSQGVDISNRVGDSIRLQGLHYAFGLTASASATLIHWTRILLVRDLENQGALPATLDVISGLSDVAFPNYINRDRFNILYDETVFFCPGIGPVADLRKGTIPLNGHILYRGTTTAATSASKGSLFLIAFSSLASNNPSLDHNVRILYTDD